MRALCVRSVLLLAYTQECAGIRLAAYKMQFEQHAARRQLVGKVNGFLYT